MNGVCYCGQIISFKVDDYNNKLAFCFICGRNQYHRQFDEITLLQKNRIKEIPTERPKDKTNQTLTTADRQLIYQLRTVKKWKIIHIAALFKRDHATIIYHLRNFGKETTPHTYIYENKGKRTEEIEKIRKEIANEPIPINAGATLSRPPSRTEIETTYSGGGGKSYKEYLREYKARKFIRNEIGQLIRIISE